MLCWRQYVQYYFCTKTSRGRRVKAWNETKTYAGTIGPRQWPESLSKSPYVLRVSKTMSVLGRLQRLQVLLFVLYCICLSYNPHSLTSQLHDSLFCQRLATSIPLRLEILICGHMGQGFLSSTKAGIDKDSPEQNSTCRFRELTLVSISLYFLSPQEKQGRAVEKTASITHQWLGLGEA